MYFSGPPPLNLGGHPGGWIYCNDSLQVEFKPSLPYPTYPTLHLFNRRPPETASSMDSRESMEDMEYMEYMEYREDMEYREYMDYLTPRREI